jgi:YebC/PmpR family DNA-binding regulatory protein
MILQYCLAQRQNHGHELALPLGVAVLKFMIREAMSGHSKWAQIKRQKGVADARRGQLFTKLAREIIVAVRQGGPNPESNLQLRLAVQKARDSNMPSENIERAIKRGSGESEASALIEVKLEGYGPGGIAVLVEALTDNRNRTIQDVRRLITRHGGNLGESGCVSWLFESRGVITVESDAQDAEEIALRAIDAGAEDVKTGNGYVEIFTQPQDLEAVRKVVEEKQHVISAELSLTPKTTVLLDDNKAVQALSLLDQLEELEDVQRVSSNIDFSDATSEKLRLRT